jgi:hypothetical protein
MLLANLLTAPIIILVMSQAKWSIISVPRAICPRTSSKEFDRPCKGPCTRHTGRAAGCNTPGRADITFFRMLRTITDTSNLNWSCNK